MTKIINVTPDGIPVECETLKDDTIDRVLPCNRSRSIDLEIQELNASERARARRAAFNSAMNYPHS